MYSTSFTGWENFFVAEVGGAAALSGLVFVVISISLQKILPNKHLRGRAFAYPGFHRLADAFLSAIGRA